MRNKVNKLDFSIQGLAHRSGVLTLIAIRDQGESLTDDDRTLLHEMALKFDGVLVNIPPQDIARGALDALARSLIENPGMRFSILDTETTLGSDLHPIAETALLEDMLRLPDAEEKP